MFLESIQFVKRPQRPEPRTCLNPWPRGYRLTKFAWNILIILIVQLIFSREIKNNSKKNILKKFRETNLWFGLWLLEGWPKKVLNQPPAWPSKPVFSRSSWLKSKTVAEKKSIKFLRKYNIIFTLEYWNESINKELTYIRSKYVSLLKDLF